MNIQFKRFDTIRRRYSHVADLHTHPIRPTIYLQAAAAAGNNAPRVD